ncbi:MAG: YiaA/YiaB family inner membrane protein [Sediminibacterium sp.]|nr:YiaA/YiaB family inner membrane protein [Sediminibacterium sp.]
MRDELEGIPVTSIYYGICWFSVVLAILLLVVGLWNADLLRSEKGFYGMAFTLALFSAVAVQKNIRDIQQFSRKQQEETVTLSERERNEN